MLFNLPQLAPNPHHPFTWANCEIRHVGDLGDRYEADVWSTALGWRWSARAGRVPVEILVCEAPTEGEMVWTNAPGGRVDTEAEAMLAATDWLRARCAALHGSCG